MSDEKNPYLLYPDHEMDRRPRYYDGQFLKADDFIDAQRYGIDRRRRHLRATTTPGVISGLDVTPGVDRVTVTAGAAVDDLGRQIVLVSDEERAIAAEARGGNVTLYVTYGEAPSDEAEGDEGTAGFTRFHELPVIGYVTTGQALPTHALVLAALRVDADGAVTADASTRPRAGLRVPGATPLALTTDDADPGRGRLDGALTVAVPDGAAHDPASPALRVEGHATVTAGLVVGQGDPTGYQGVANAGADLVVAGRVAAAGGAALHTLGVGYPLPAQGEGSLTARRLAVGRQTVDGGYTVDVAGAVKASGDLTVGGDVQAADALIAGGGLDVAAATTLRGGATVGARLDVNGPATTDGLRVDGVAEVYGNLGATGTLTVDGTVRAAGKLLDLGAAVAGRQVDAGKIGYGTFEADTLGIVGAGATQPTRKVTIWSEGGLSVRGPADVTGALTAGSVASDGALSAGGALAVEGDATVRGSLNTVGGALVQGRMAIGQSDYVGYGGVTADANDLVVNGQFAAGGTGGAAMYSLAIGTSAQANREGWLFVGNRIGVNNTNPQRRLDVDGTARVTGDTEVGGTLDVTGATDIGGAADVTGKLTAKASAQVHGTLWVAAGDGNGIRFPDNAYGGGGDWAGLRYWRPEGSGENTRLELGSGNDTGDVVVLKQKNTDVVTLYNTKVGVGVSEPSYKLQVAGDLYNTGDHRIDGLIDLGAKDGEREANSGKIAYANFNGGARELQLVGAGTASNNRVIRLWSEGGLRVQGTIYANDKPAVVSQNNPVRVIWGAVKSDGSLWTGDGFTCARTGTTGIFKVDFAQNYSARPCGVATQRYPIDNDNADNWGNTLDNAVVARVTSSYCYVKTGDGNGNGTWRSFEFIAIGR
ncbi:MAG: hypothetical protein R3F65_18000 [bacterium]